MAQLDLLVSGPGTGKTTRCIDLFREEVSRSGGGIDSCSYFVLPSREHAERIQNLVLKKGMPGLFNAHILSMNDLAPRLLRSSGNAHPTDALRRMILKRLAEAGPGGASLLYFEAVKSFSGFHELLSDAVKEFNAGLIGIADFENLAQPLLKEPAFRAKFRDFCVLLKNYELELDRLGLEEPEKDIERLKDARELAEKPSLIIFDGFYHFTRAQKQLIEFSARRAGRVVVTLTLPDRPAGKENLFEYPERTRLFLRGAGFKEAKIPAQSHRVQNKALLHLEKNIFLPRPAIFKGSADGITRLEAPGIRAEIEMIAREIRNLYREGSYHFSDMCLILRSVSPYEKIIRSVFAELEVPVHVHERHRLVQNGPVQTFYRFLELVRDGWKREDLFYLLKSSFFDSRAAVEQVLAFEAAAFRENVSEGRAAWQTLAGEKGIADRVKVFVQHLADWEDRFLSAADMRQFSRRTEEFMSSLDAAPAEPGMRRQDEQAMACLKAILQSSRRYYESSEARVFETRQLISEILESIERGLFSDAPEGKNLVQVYDAVMALPKEFKVVFIGGLLEKIFPQAVTEDPLFKDRERQVLNRKETVLEERLWRVAGERYFFYMALSRAKEKLYLSYPAYDADARPTLPSFFLEEAQRCFAPGAVRVIRKDPDHFLPGADEWQTDAEVSRGLGELLFSAEKKDVSADRVLFPLLAGKRGDDLMAGILEQGLASPEAAIRDPRARAEFSRIRDVFSATRLETYATCAFRYFASKILKLNEPAEGHEAMYMGTMLHNTLEEYYKSLTAKAKKSGRYLEDPELMKGTLFLLLDAEMQKGLFRNEPPYRQKIYLTSMRETLASFVDHERELGDSRGLVPAHFELGFGKDVKGVLDYLEIKNGASPIRITGKIDRIDLTPDGKKALVIDYKRSKRENSIKQKLEKGLELQLPIYLLVAKKLLGLEPLGAELRILRTAGKEGIYLEEAADMLGAPKGQRRTAPEFGQMLDDAENRVRGIVGRLKDADITVRSKSCNYCEFDPVCRFEKWKLIYQK